MNLRAVAQWLGLNPEKSAPASRKEPLVSVLMASFNHEPFVTEAVASVLSQDLTDIELIVVDDASSDHTADIVAAVRDPRLTIVRMPHNRGVQVRNWALGLARGRYIAFQNSDDIWQPDKLARQVEVMESESELVACFTGIELIDKEGNATLNTWANNLFTLKNRAPEAWLRHFFDFGNCLALPSAMVRRADLLRLGGFRGSLVQLSDFDLWIRAAALGRFTILPTPLTQMRIVDGVNLSAPTARTSRRSRIELATVLERFIQPEVLCRFPVIFPELLDPGSSGARKVTLALRAIERHGAAGLVFADRTIASVLDDVKMRAAALEAHGPGFIRDFLERRCEMELTLS